MTFVKPLLTSVFMLMTLTAQASAVLEIELASCAANRNDSQRLECFDRVYQQFSQQIASLANNPATPTHRGNWTITTSPSLTSAGFNIALRLESDNSITSRTQTVRPVLELICKDGKSLLAMHWGVYLGKNRTTMLTRIDANPADRRDWIIKDKYTVYSQGDNQQIVRQLKDSSSLIAQISPYNAESSTATFKLTGLKQQLEAYALSCDW